MSEAVEILIKADDQASKEFGDAAASMEAAQKRVNQIMGSLEEPADRYAKQLAELNDLHKSGALNADQFAAASAKISEKLANTGNAFKDVGGKAKTTTEFIGTLASLTGNSEIAGLASQLAGATEKVSQFSEVSKAGGAGAFAFKLGLVSLAAAGGAAVGKFLGDIIFETKKFTREMARATEASKELETRLSKTRDNLAAGMRQDIELIRDPAEKQAAYKALLSQLEKDIQGVTGNVSASQKAVDEWADSWQITGNRKEYAKQAQEQLENDKARLEALREERDELQKITSERARQIEEIEKANEAKDKSESYIATLREEIEYLAATKEEQIKLDAARNTTIEDRGEAEKLLLERDAINAKREAQEELEEAQRRAEEDRIKAAEQAAADAQREIDRVGDLVKAEEQRIAMKRFELDQQQQLRQSSAAAAAEMAQAQSAMNAGMESATAKQAAVTAEMVRAQELMNSGIDEATAKQTAAAEAAAAVAIRVQEAVKAQELMNQGVDENTAKRLAAAEAETQTREGKDKSTDQAQQDAEKEKQRVRDLVKAEEERLALRKLENEQGKEAARIQSLMNQGVDEETAKRLAAAEAALEGNNKPDIAKDAPKLQASESRLLTRGEGNSPAEKTNELLTAVRDVMAQTKEVNAAQLEEQRRIAENTSRTQKVTTVS